MRGVIIPAIFLGLLASARAETALDAIAKLPQDAQSRVALVEGRDGAPEPEEWHILTPDSSAESGVHEFVVSNGQIVRSQAFSQFAPSPLKDEDILGALPAIDSDKASSLAHDYAAANGAVVASINYDLKKDGPGAAPTWVITCLDDNGNKLGEVVVTADKGAVVSHTGFALEPSSEPRKKEDPHFETYAQPEVAIASAAIAPPADEEIAGYRHHWRSAKPSPNPIVRGIQSATRTLKKLF